MKRNADRDQHGDPEQAARTICLRLLERRACTRAELAAAMSKRAVADDVADRVLDRFVELGLVDDAAFADGYARAQHSQRGLAGRAVAAKLRRRGLDDETVAAAVEQIDPEAERAAARSLVDHRMPSLSGLDPLAKARRLVGLLARKGYSPALAHDVVREAIRAAEVDICPDDIADFDALSD